MASYRKLNISTYDHLYTVVNGERADLYWRCVYCGLPADTRDHYPPISRVDDYRALRLDREIYIKVPSCTRCNSILSNSLQESFIERVEQLKNKLSRKWFRFLKIAEWDEEEYEELGRNLRSLVKSEHDKRLKYAAMIDYYTGLDIVLENLEV